MGIIVADQGIIYLDSELQNFILILINVYNDCEIIMNTYTNARVKTYHFILILKEFRNFNSVSSIYDVLCFTGKLNCLSFNSHSQE